ncbi:hypothetical protein SODALDRAFT_335113 [Sodiomyces alkalinus F11]|uniref:Uncharacterized protein n=1 Tax=Sodiomyces alkalinus (strain CBS 110278 / VKM F-3762 / F11) TaxID=1314773 RepID=A0A3N2PR16_SODAK|nr:hypothetical protein SODALDRAFT_335113 [Sodiomyces alkalinus F11]ROT36894.1 hypothetical protein SODALDRAFT_335113 [Sodiomyces alkalinus F11]
MSPSLALQFKRGKVSKARRDCDEKSRNHPRSRRRTQKRERDAARSTQHHRSVRGVIPCLLGGWSQHKVGNTLTSGIYRQRCKVGGLP